MIIGGFRGASAVLGAICVAVTVVGCSGSSPEAAGPVSTPTVTVAPTPTPTPTPDAITCDTAFVADLNTKMAADGLTFAGAGVSTAVDALVGTDGLRCRWARPHTDIVVRYANWMRGAAAWDALKTQLLADGYIETGPLDVARTASEFDSAYSFRDGIIHYASPSWTIGSATALQ